MEWATVIQSVAACLPFIGGGLGYVYQLLSKKMKECDAERMAMAARIAVLESAIGGGDFPRWIRDEHDRIVSVSPEFVRLLGAPYGYNYSDFLGHRLSELDRIPPVFAESISEIHRTLQLGQSRYVVKHGVDIGHTVATIIKAVIPTPSGMVYSGIAVPE